MITPSGWRELTPHQIAGEDKSALVIGPFGSSLKVADYRAHGVPLIFVRDIRTGDFSAPRRFIDESKTVELRAHLAEPGDVLITKMGAPPGDSCVYTGNQNGVITADCIRLRPTADFDARYISLALGSPQVRSQIGKITSGVAQMKVSLARFRNGITLPVPELAEQRRIVDLLEDHISRLDAAADGLLKARKRIDSLERSALETHFAMGTLVPLADLIEDISAGKSFGTSNSPAGKDDWGIIKVSAMTSGRFNPNENKAVPADRVDPRFEIRVGDLLVSRANTADYVGASVLVGSVRPKLLLSDKSLRLTPKACVHPEWLWRALQAPSARRQITASATGTKDSMRNISQVALRQVLLPKVGEAVQSEALNAFAAVATSTNRLRTEIDGCTVRLANLRRSLLANAFSGRLTGAALDSSPKELAGP